MVVVDNCLCFQLETGGLILGWFGIIFDAIFVLFILALLTGYSSMTCDDISKNEQFREIVGDLSDKDCQVLKTVLLTIMIIALISFAIGFVISVLLVKGIRNRNANLILPSVVASGIGCVSYIFRSLFAFTLTGFLNAIIGGAIMIYFFVVLFSLYIKVRDEKRRGFNAQYGNA